MRILAFGDSLTAGYHRMGTAFAPWAGLLCELVHAHRCDHIGLSGWTTVQMVDSLDHHTVTDVVPRQWPGLQRQLDSAQYDVVLILAGTNDLADRVPTSTLLDNLASLHARAHAAGARTVAMTIPESKAAKVVDWLAAGWHDANAAIRSWALAQPPERVHFVDAATLVPFREGGTPRLWEMDGLHMSKEGYEAFGRGLAPLVRDFVHRTPPRQPHAGMAVRIVRLQRAAQHNGKIGRLLGRTGAEGRLGVELDGGTRLAVRRENVEWLTSGGHDAAQDLD